MARQSRRARSRRGQEPARDDIFTHFEASTPRARDRDASEDPETDREPTARELLERIAGLQGEIKALRERPEPTMRAQEAPAAAAVTAKDVKFSTEGLPSPLENLDEYNRLLTERINAFVAANGEAVRADVQGRVESTTSAERMRREFYSANPEWEDHDKIVGIVAAEIAEEQGLTPAAIAKKPRAFYNAVAKRLDERYGALIADRDDDDEADEPDDYVPTYRRERNRDRRRERDDGDDGRTAGMFSGMEAGGRPTPSRKARQEQGDMIAELHAEQRKSGFF